MDHRLLMELAFYWLNGGAENSGFSHNSLLPLCTIHGQHLFH